MTGQASLLGHRRPLGMTGLLGRRSDHPAIPPGKAARWWVGVSAASERSGKGSLRGQSAKGSERLGPSAGAWIALEASALGMKRALRANALLTRTIIVVMPRSHQQQPKPTGPRIATLSPNDRSITEGRLGRRYGQSQVTGPCPPGRRCTQAWATGGPHRRGPPDNGPFSSHKGISVRVETRLATERETV